MKLNRSQFTIKYPAIMGICNLTKDSFSDGGLFIDSKSAIKRANICIEQGYQMGRPSSLHVQIEQRHNEIKSIRVGGEAVTVIEGWVNI